MITVVTPWLALAAIAGVASSARSSWVCTSMKPGATQSPATSISCRPLPRGNGADRRDAVAGDRDIGACRRRAGAVEHTAAAQDQIIGRHRAAHALAAMASTSTSSPGRARALMTSRVEAGRASPSWRARTLP